MKTFLLWILAVILTLAALIYQRSTGPTYPFRGKLTHQEKEYSYKLLRSQETTQGALIELPNIESDHYFASLHYKRYKKWTVSLRWFSASIPTGNLKRNSPYNPLPEKWNIL